MFYELLALNEEMILQLRLEREGVGGIAGFMAAMIDQHETAAAMLRARIKRHHADAL